MRVELERRLLDRGLLHLLLYQLQGWRFGTTSVMVPRGHVATWEHPGVFWTRDSAADGLVQCSRWASCWIWRLKGLSGTVGSPSERVDLGGSVPTFGSSTIQGSELVPPAGSATIVISLNIMPPSVQSMCLSLAGLNSPETLTKLLCSSNSISFIFSLSAITQVGV